jgi:hypothetical protein
MTHDPAHPAPDVASRRRAAVRTAVIVGAIAACVYVAFILSGVLAS